ncbi:hypothetical protein SDC9_83596 [bioreactor metagenome]|uniref:Uncharacterized protein n=1 Tax=bioreactor metagenome TaxID=1076179 RepID=A0A644Z870_9ZZZZ
MEKRDALGGGGDGPAERADSRNHPPHHRPGVPGLFRRGRGPAGAGGVQAKPLRRAGDGRGGIAAVTGGPPAENSSGVRGFAVDGFGQSGPAQSGGPQAGRNSAFAACHKLDAERGREFHAGRGGAGAGVHPLSHTGGDGRIFGRGAGRGFACSPAGPHLRGHGRQSPAAGGCC